MCMCLILCARVRVPTCEVIGYLWRRRPLAGLAAGLAGLAGLGRRRLLRQRLLKNIVRAVAAALRNNMTN